MKKLIVSEVVSVMLVLGIFLLVFTLLNGWDKDGKERYDAAVVAVAVAAAVAAAVAVAAGLAVAGAGAAVAAVAAAGAALIAVGVVGGVAAAAVAAVAAVVAALIAVGVVGGVVGDYRINAPKKIIWFSLGAEAVAIIAPVLLITFC